MLKGAKIGAFALWSARLESPWSIELKSVFSNVNILKHMALVGLAEIIGVVNGSVTCPDEKVRFLFWLFKSLNYLIILRIL